MLLFFKLIHKVNVKLIQCSSLYLKGCLILALILTIIMKVISKSVSKIFLKYSQTFKIVYQNISKYNLNLSQQNKSTF